MSGDWAVFTVATAGYLSHVRTLFASVREHLPEARRIFVLADSFAGRFDPAREPFETLLAENIGLPHFRELAFQYNTLAFCCAIKSFAARYLMNNRKFDLLYLDADAVLLRRPTEALEALRQKPVQLSPHLCQSLGPGSTAEELKFVGAGAFNAGFLGFKQEPLAFAFLDWWSQRVTDGCLPESLYDQKWLDLAPALFEDIGILKHPGYNAAYWNLAQRPITRDAAGGFQAAGLPLTLFHFSGFPGRDPEDLSRYAPGRKLGAEDPAIRSLFETYRAQLTEAGYSESSSWPYGYAAFHNGIRITDPMRTWFRTELGGRLDPGVDPFDPKSGRPSVFERLCAFPGDGPLNTHALLLHASNPQVQRAFPLVPGRDTDSYAAWLVNEGALEQKLDPALVDPVRQRLGPALARGAARKSQLEFERDIWKNNYLRLAQSFPIRQLLWLRRRFRGIPDPQPLTESGPTLTFPKKIKPKDPSSGETGRSETSRCRERLAPYCLGYGLDLGFGGDPILEESIRVDLPTPYTKVGDYPVQLGGDLSRLPWFSDGVLDYIFSSHLLEDFEDTESVLREWLRVLKPGGRLIIYCPDEVRYRAHCQATGQSYNAYHKHADFSLSFIKNILLRIGGVRFLHESAHVEDYSWEVVCVKDPTPEGDPAPLTINPATPGKA